MDSADRDKKSIFAPEYLGVESTNASQSREHDVHAKRSDESVTETTQEDSQVTEGEHPQTLSTGPASYTTRKPTRVVIRARIIND